MTIPAKPSIEGISTAGESNAGKGRGNVIRAGATLSPTLAAEKVYSKGCQVPAIPPYDEIDGVGWLRKNNFQIFKRKGLLNLFIFAPERGRCVYNTATRRKSKRRGNVPASNELYGCTTSPCIASALAYSAPIAKR